MLLIDDSYGQKIYICTKTLHYLSQRAPPTQTNNALNQQIRGTVLWLHTGDFGTWQFRMQLSLKEIDVY